MSKPLIDEKGEVRELTAEDFKRIRPARVVHPEIPARVQGPASEPRFTPESHWQTVKRRLREILHV